jgi:hypothetical protein
MSTVLAGKHFWRLFAMTHTKSLNASSIDPKAIAYVEKLAHRWREANGTF